MLCAVVGLKAFDFKCDLRDVESQSQRSIEKCTTSDLQIISRQTVTSVNGKDSNTFKGRSYKTIVIEYQTVYFLPQGLGNFFPNIIAISVDHSQLKEINKDDLAQFPKLQQFNVSESDLKSLSGDLFEGNLHLSSISFMKNQLNHIGRGILKPLKHLTQARFANNTCISQNAEKFTEIPSLVAAFQANCRNDTVDDELNRKRIREREAKDAIKQASSRQRSSIGMIVIATTLVLTIIVLTILYFGAARYRRFY